MSLKTDNRHATIPVFVPHYACPHQCVFCNQKKISGQERINDDLGSVREYLSRSISDIKNRFSKCDIAFFGGSFTGIPEEKMIEYLKIANEFFGKGITGIRLSTRPDYISDHILDILEKYNVTDIELGVQSFDDRVLKLSERGHDSFQTEESINLIKKRDFRLVLQIMPGLPGDDEKSIRYTIDKTAEYSPFGVRIYPTIVIKNTPLEKLYLQGIYKPLSLEDAIQYTAYAVKRFEENDITIIRMGLHSSSLSQNDGVVAGPYHPAFGEMVIQQLFVEKAINLLSAADIKDGSATTLIVAKGGISRLVGQNKKNIETIRNRFGIEIKVIEDPKKDIKDDPISDPYIKILT